MVVVVLLRPRRRAAGAPHPGWCRCQRPCTPSPMQKRCAQGWVLWVHGALAVEACPPFGAWLVDDEPWTTGPRWPAAAERARLPSCTRWWGSTTRRRHHAQGRRVLGPAANGPPLWAQAAREQGVGWVTHWAGPFRTHWPQVPAHVARLAAPVRSEPQKTDRKARLLCHLMGDNRVLSITLRFSFAYTKRLLPT